MGAKSYKELDIWSKGIEIVNAVYALTKSFPKDELFGLTSQMKRSVVSIPANIAEGFARYHNKEFKQFLYIALGSCAELETQLIVSFNQKYTPKTVYEEILESLNHECRMLTNMIKYVSSSHLTHKLYTNNGQRSTNTELCSQG